METSLLALLSFNICKLSCYFLPWHKKWSWRAFTYFSIGLQWVNEDTTTGEIYFFHLSPLRFIKSHFFLGKIRISKKLIQKLRSEPGRVKHTCACVRIVFSFCQYSLESFPASILLLRAKDSKVKFNLKDFQTSSPCHHSYSSL